MRWLSFSFCVFFLVAPIRAAGERSAAELSVALQHLSLDAEQTYRVRDLHLTRGDIKFYLSEGVLSFARPVAGHIVAAVFTTQNTEAGDAEMLVLPPRLSERVSLASFTKSPNLNEHFRAAAFFFSDDTADELLRQITEPAVHRVPQLLGELQSAVEPILRGISTSAELRLIESLLDRHNAHQGFLLSVIAGRELGVFQAFYDPDLFEPVTVSKVGDGLGGSTFQLWTSFRPRQAVPFIPPPVKLSSYHIDSTINEALKLSAVAEFSDEAVESEGRVLRFELSDRLQVNSAEIDGQPVEVFQRRKTELADQGQTESAFLLVGDKPIGPGPHRIKVAYGGSTIRQAPVKTYFVDDRTTWFPHAGTMRTTFDLIFHCPSYLRLVSTGELLSDEVNGRIRTVHRRSTYPEALAGFNLGEFQLDLYEAGQYRVESYSNSTEARGGAVIAEKAADILDYYTRRWQTLPSHTLAVSPIPGYFGQGFPGLIYLSAISFIREEDRPAALRNSRMTSFFSQMLLPHEIAHQWWGNLVVPADYRTDWLVEAMASYSALQYLQERLGQAVMRSTLDGYREDLLANRNGQYVDGAGPIDMGIRLVHSAGAGVWNTITYEKGAWILRMLHWRLGDDRFRRMQLALINRFGTQALTNEDFRRIAASFMPLNQPDRDLSLFFETWVYNTGIPFLTLQHGPEGWNLLVLRVDESFTADIPLQCQEKSKGTETRWVRVGAGPNPLTKVPKSASCALPDASQFLYIS